MCIRDRLPTVVWQLDDGRPRHHSNGLPGAQSPRVARTVALRVTGTPRGLLTPGIASQIQLHFLNSQREPVAVRRVEIQITGIVAPQADVLHPCTRTDFRLRQMPARTLLLPSRVVTDLTGLGVPLRSWPRLKLRNRPGNQDGCKGAHLTLGYRVYGGPS